MTVKQRAARRDLIMRRARARAVSKAQTARWTKYREACAYGDPMTDHAGPPDRDMDGLPETL